MVMLNPVAGDDRAGAVAPVFAMHKNRTGRFVNDGKHPRHLAWLRPAHPFQRDVDEGDAVAGGFSLFRRPKIVGHAQADNSFDAKLLQAGEAGRIGLSPATKVVVDLAEVGNAVRDRHAAIRGLAGR